MKDYGNGSVYQRSDGKWVAAIFVNGKKRVRYAKPNSEKAARSLIKTLWQEIGREEEQTRLAAAGTHQTVKTVAAFVEDWLAAETLKPTTVESYRYNLKAHVLSVIGTRHLDEVTSADVASLVASILKSGASQRTAQYAYSLVRRLLQVAYDWDIIPTNPAAKVKRPKVDREEKEVWTKGQAETFIRYAKECAHPWDDLFLVALLSGLRLGELLGLEWQDVDLQAGTISVKRNLVELDGGVFKTQTPKSKASIRTVSLPKDALDALGNRLDKAKKDNGPIFRRDAGRDRPRYNGIDANPIPRRNAIREAFRDACRRAGVPYISFHGLRHMHVSLLAQAGVSVKEAQQRVGHSNPMMTLQTYTHVLDDAERRIAGKLDELLGGSSPQNPERRSGAKKQRRLPQTVGRPSGAVKKRVKTSQNIAKSRHE